VEALRLRQKVSALEQEVMRLRQELDSLKRSGIEGRPRSDAGRGMTPPIATNRFNQRDLDRVMDDVARSLPKIFETAMRSEASDALTLRAALAERYQAAHPERQSLDIALGEFQHRLATAATSKGAKTASASDDSREQVQAAIANLRNSMDAIRAHVSPLTDVQRSAQIMNGLREEQRLMDQRRRELDELTKRILELNQQNQGR
jgi:hypothetical protein